MNAKIHTKLARCLWYYIELELVRPLTQQRWRLRVPVACEGGGGGVTYI